MLTFRIAFCRKFNVETGQFFSYLIPTKRLHTFFFKSFASSYSFQLPPNLNVNTLRFGGRCETGSY